MKGPDIILPIGKLSFTVQLSFQVNQVFPKHEKAVLF